MVEIVAILEPCAQFFERLERLPHRADRRKRRRRRSSQVSSQACRHSSRQRASASSALFSRPSARAGLRALLPDLRPRRVRLRRGGEGRFRRLDQAFHRVVGAVSDVGLAKAFAQRTARTLRFLSQPVERSLVCAEPRRPAPALRPASPASLRETRADRGPPARASAGARRSRARARRALDPQPRVQPRRERDRPRRRRGSPLARAVRRSSRAPASRAAPAESSARIAVSKESAVGAVSAARWALQALSRAARKAMAASSPMRSAARAAAAASALRRPASAAFCAAPSADAWRRAWSCDEAVPDRRRLCRTGNDDRGERLRVRPSRASAPQAPRRVSAWSFRPPRARRASGRPIRRAGTPEAGSSGVRRPPRRHRSAARRQWLRRARSAPSPASRAPPRVSIQLRIARRSGPRSRRPSAQAV